MILLKLHFSISVLCLLGFIGVKVIFDQRLRRFKTKEKGKKRLRNYLLFFCPVVNILFLVTGYYMAFCDDATVDSINKKNVDKEI